LEWRPQLPPQSTGAVSHSEAGEPNPDVTPRARRPNRIGRCHDRLVYVNTSKQVGDTEHVKVFATTDAAEKWFEKSDPEGVAFEYEVLE